MPGHWTIDVDRREVRDADGAHVALRRRSFDLLLYLAGHHDQIVSKDELIGANWPGLTVTDDSLTKCISDIRAALGEGLRDTVRTVSGRGYRLSGWFADGSRLTSSPVRSIGARDASGAPSRMLFGRADSTSKLVRLLGTRQLVTILGPGGVGKTAIARAVTDAAPSVLHVDTCFVELAPLRPGASVEREILANLGEADGLPLPALLADRHLLLVLDNCEHLLDEVARMIERLIASAPRLVVLATSREPLGLDNEQHYRLPTLPFPESTEIPLAEALNFPAVQMLVQRAGLADAGFVLPAAHVPDAIAICRQLDGMPLALSLAGARLGTMSLPELAASLAQKLDLLSSSGRAVDARHRTLRATLQWSFDLLTPQEQILLAQIGVFAASVTLDDVLAVCRTDNHPPNRVTVFSLADKSLLSVERAEGSPTRYRLHEITRAFAVEQLADADAVRARLCGYLITVLKTAEGDLERMPTQAWRERYSPYLDNLRAAFAWASSADKSSDHAVRLAAYGAHFLDELSHEAERLAWVELADALPVTETDPAVAGRLKLWRAINTGWGIGDPAFAQDAADCFAQSGEPLLHGRSLAVAALGRIHAGASNEAWMGFAEAEALTLPFGSTRTLNDMLRYRALSLVHDGRFDEADRDLVHAIRVADEIGDEAGSLWAREQRIDIAFERGDLAGAVAMQAAFLEEARRVSIKDLLFNLTALAAYRLLADDPDVAARDIDEAFSIARRSDNNYGVHTRLMLVAYLAALRGDMALAARLASFSQANAPGTSARRFEASVAGRLATLLDNMERNERAEAEHAGRAWSLDAALEAAQGVLPAS